jgi:MerR family copper efflux transcriptional regulator
MAEGLTIGTLAHKAGMPASTVRYYERSGLIKAPPRSESNYRLYSEDAVERLQFIKAAQSTGFTLADIKALLAYRDGETAPCSEVRHLIEHRLEKIEEKMSEFRHVRRVLKGFLKKCVEAEEAADCHMMEKLDHEPH